MAGRIFWQKADDDRLMDMVAEGVSFKQIGPRMGVSWMSAKRRFDVLAARLGE